MEPQPLLTIGIPTYQRAARLQKLLESIATQRTGVLIAKIEVLISDNASTDDTWSVCQKYAARYGFTVRRNDVNVGMDRNLLKIREHARGTFTWWMGDDDWVREGFLRWICEHLEHATEDFFFVPAGGQAESTRLMGVNIEKRATLWELVCEHGCLRILGTIGHCLYRSALLEDYESIVDASSCFSHVFGLLLAFKNRDAVLLLKGGFDVGYQSPEYHEQYTERWKSEKLYTEGWIKTGTLIERLIENELIPEPPPTFFQMFVSQAWPLQFHMLRAIKIKVFEQHEFVHAEELSTLIASVKRLNDHQYLLLTANIVQAIIAQNESPEPIAGIRENVELLLGYPWRLFDAIMEIDPVEA